MRLVQKTFIFVVMFFLCYTSVSAKTKNGFDISNAIIPKEQIFSGGPPKDGIPSINNPKFIDIKDVDYLKDEDIVIGFVHKGIQRAYPTRILVWHEIVNDTLDDLNIAVTYCPLCGTAMVFNRYINNKLRSFGVSGLLYQSDVLMYDRQTNSLWSQLAMEAISGKSVGKKLTWLPSAHLTFKAWKAKYPKSQVLSLDTGYSRNYKATPYSSYFKSDDVMFPVPKNRDELSNKAWVVGIIVNGVAKAYDIKKLPHNKVINDKVGDTNIHIVYDKVKNHPVVTTKDNKEIPSVLVYWFAWQAFYPNTALHK
jgi:hypothetical protein